MSLKFNKKVVLGLSDPLELVSQPYKIVAERLGISEQRLLRIIRKYKSAGLIRRVGTVLGHFKAGYKCNALVMWQVEDAGLETAGKIFAGFPQVTHCYARQTYPDWPYNLYTMVHARNKNESQTIIKAMSTKAGITSYKIQFTVKEFKKIKSDLKEILS
ncbi:MAG: Lrp/AsnC family transcriptional regulator [Candidatus Omnitrophica bacterium]|nr:Lrp/AsnC family transcriptional regulator [Candidatus Omnitrophota bacterium]